MTGNDTIFAPATAPGRAGVAVLRISGAHVRAALAALGVALPKPRVATLADAGGIDKALVLWFPAPASFTGEDVAELHVHGSRAVMQALIATLSALPGLRLAEPGEFARRAFLNGKMDLTEVEGLADLIDAETEAQRRQALAQMQGEMGERFERLRAQAVRALAHLEAIIDFPEEDIPTALLVQIEEEAKALRGEVKALLADGVRGRRIREGVNIVILGAPNAGKSSLMNTLAKRDVAIVSHIAGTTRDVIEAHLDIGGYATVLVDTAGLRDSDDPVEQEGIRRARARAEAADLRIVIFDASALPALDSESLTLCDGALVVLNKIDTATATLPPSIRGQRPLPLSLATDEGIEALLRVMEQRLSDIVSGDASPMITRQRHADALGAALVHLEAFSLMLPTELAAEELRLASVELGKITGKIAVDELLDRIFSEFCIGK